MASCGKCSVLLDNNREVITCSQCKHSFHPACSRVESFERYKKMSAQRKSVWKCDGCHNESSSNASQSDNESIGDMLKNMKSELSKEINSVKISINANIEGVKSQLVDVNSSIATIQGSLSALSEENEHRKEEFARLSQENSSLRTEMNELQSRVQDLEQYSRRDNIEIVGVPYTKNESLQNILSKIARVLNIPMSRDDFSTVHRLPVSRSRPNPPIIARCVVRDCKEGWISAFREHRNKLTAAELSDSFPSTPVFVNDHLTSHNKILLGKARQLKKDKKIAYIWTRDCRVLAKKTFDPSCPTTVLRTMDDLNKLME